MDTEEEIDVETSGSCPGSPLVAEDTEQASSDSLDAVPSVVPTLPGSDLPSFPETGLVCGDGDQLRHDLFQFDPTADMQELLLNASADSLMDIPLFNEVDSLMNIKTEDHFMDSIFYLPSGCTFEPLLKLNGESTLESLMTETAMVNSGTARLNVEEDSVVSPILIQPKGDGTPSVTPTNTIRNSTDILGSNFITAPGQMGALEHMLRAETEGASKGKCARRVRGGRQTSSGSQASLEDGTVEVGTEQLLANLKGNVVLEIKPEDCDSLLDSGDSPLSSPGHGETDCGLQAEIDRFVICSDHTMECVLCAFTTESYSAFKSHIICSHPCWRITKKLSKNRLLVEKAVRGGNSLNLLLPAYHNRCSSEACTKDPGVKHSRKNERSARKRQIYERNKRLFRCTVCLRLFVFEGSVVNHVAEHHCSKDRPYDYIHISNDHGQTFGPIYRCQKSNCYFSCESASELERHSLEQHTAVIYRCQLCGFTAGSAAAVHAHGLRMHQQQLTCFC